MPTERRGDAGATRNVGVFDRLPEGWWTSRIAIPVAVAMIVFGTYFTYHLGSIQLDLLDALADLRHATRGVLRMLGWIAELALELALLALDYFKSVHYEAYIRIDILVNLVFGFIISVTALLFCYLLGGFIQWLPPVRDELELQCPRSGAQRITCEAFIFTGLFVILEYVIIVLASGDDDFTYYMSVSGFIWAGFVAAAALLYLRTLCGSTSRRAIVGIRHHQVEMFPSLKKLYNDYRSLGGGAGLVHSDARSVGSHSRMLGPVPATSSGGLGLAGGDFVNRTTEELRLTEDGRRTLEQFLIAIGRNDIGQRSISSTGNVNAYFEEPLGDIHYRALAETISMAQDEGGGTLFLCPAIAFRTVRDKLSSVFTDLCTEVTQTWWCEDEGDFDPTSVPSLMMVTHEGLQDRVLGRRAADFDRPLERLRLIVLVDAHRFDPALLHLHLALLWLRAPAQRIRVVAQAAPRAGAKDLYEHLFGATGRTWREFSLRSVSASTIYTLIFSRARTIRNALLNDGDLGLDVPTERRRGIDVVPTILLPALRVGARCSLLDPWESKDTRRWELLDERLRGGGDGDTRSVTLRDVETVRQATFDPGPRVVLVEDRGNLHDIFTELYQGQLPHEFLVLVASHAYPLRDFLADPRRLDEAFKGLNGAAFLPIAPRPRGGLRELALVILLRLLSPPGADRDRGAGALSRAEATRYFEAVRDPDLLRAFQVSPTRHGIETLLRSQFEGSNFSVEVDRRQRRTVHRETSLASPIDDDDEARYFCRSAAALPDQLKPFATVVAEGMARREIGWIARDDHGLAFVRGTVVLIKGDHYKIARVGPEITVAALNDPGASFPVEGGIGFRFWRLYQLPFGDRAVVSHNRESDARGGLSGGRTLLHAPIRRATVGYHVTDTLDDTGSQAVIASSEHLTHGDIARSAYESVNVAVIRYHFSKKQTGQSGDISRIAFTLAALLGDVLEALFPGMGHRIAVMSPQAGPVFERLRSDDNGAARALARRYPRIVAAESDIIEGIPAPPEVVEASIDEAVGAMTRRSGVTVEGDRSGFTTVGDDIGRIDLLVVEDWPTDLGIARAVHDRSAQIERALAEFGGWLVERADSDTNFYRFGGDRISDAFDFSGAARIAGLAAGHRTEEGGS